jgi:hypothetical protein
MTNEKKTENTVSIRKWYSPLTDKIKWFFSELLAMYSGKPSYFSKKRIESGVAFIIAQWGMIFFLLEKHSTLSMGEFLLWAAAEFAVSGYIINKIQQEKKNESE